MSAFLLAFSAPAFAQLATDQVPRARTIPVEESVKQEVTNGRLRLGPLRILPTLTVNNAGYDNNVFGTPETCPPITGCNSVKTGDWTATISGGARLVAPVGTKVYVRGEVLPQYTWYRELSNRRTFGGFYRASVLGFFNRMSLEVGGYASKSFGFLTSETETRVVQDVKDGSANLEVDLTRALSLFATGEAMRIRNSSTGDPGTTANFRSLDRDEAAVRGGVRYRISSQWSVSAAVEGTRSEFVERPDLADNQSTAYLLGIYYSRPRFFANVSGGYRKGQSLNGSTFPGYNTSSGSYFLSYFLFRKLELQAFGHRGISYGSLFPIPTYFVETRYGGGVNLEVHPRVLLRGYGEYGTNDFPVPEILGEVTVHRNDKSSSLGGGVSVLVTRKVALTALVSRYKYDSLFPGLTRTVVRYTTGLSFEGVLAR